MEYYQSIVEALTPDTLRLVALTSFVLYLSTLVPDPPSTEDIDKWSDSFYHDSERYGGADRDWKEYTKPNKNHYANKPDHLERSTHHQPNHAEHKKDK